MREVVQTSAAPAAIGPYSQAVMAAGFVFTSGQIALDPVTGKMTGKTVGEQTERVLENLRAVLVEAGSSLAHVTRTTVYLTDLTRFDEANRVYERYFPDAPPARSTVGVASLPRGALIEVDAIALRP